MPEKSIVPHPIGVESIYPGVAVITLNRPERRNALSIAMLEQLVQEIDRLANDLETRVVILRGTGPVFSAGLDLVEASNPNMIEESARSVAAALHALRASPLVSIAAVHGGAYAGGAGLMAACDMAVGSSDLIIAFPEAQRGLLPALICEALRWKVREGDLRELFLVGHAIDARRAEQIGLLQRVAEPENLLEQATLMAKGILAGGPETIVKTKSLLNRLYEATAANRNAEDQAAIHSHVQARRSPEAAEGLRAYLEKRPPRWQ